MWVKFRTWVRRFAGITFNTIVVLLPIGLAITDWAGVNVDWKELFGEEKGALYLTGIGFINMLFRIFVTRTQGHPSDPLVSS